MFSRAQLQSKLPEGLYIQIEEHVDEVVAEVNDTQALRICKRLHKDANKDTRQSMHDAVDAYWDVVDAGEE